MNSLEVSSVKNDNGEKCITSLAIAEMTGKDHSKVIRDIKAMLEGLGLDEARFGSVYLGGNNQERPMFILPEREALTLASGYDVKLRVKVVDFFLNGHKPMSELDMIIASAIELKGVKESVAKLENTVQKLENMSEKIIEDVVEIVATNQPKEKLPPHGFRGVTRLRKDFGLSKDVITELAEYFDVRKAGAVKIVEGVATSYFAYSYDDMKNAYEELRYDAVQVSPHFYEANYITGRFKISKGR